MQDLEGNFQGDGALIRSVFIIYVLGGQSDAAFYRAIEGKAALCL
jgi:hypothetical protein